eukprot:scaffold116902_cov58-Cyclotella_meneghiniana.AAC.1
MSIDFVSSFATTSTLSHDVLSFIGQLPSTGWGSFPIISQLLSVASTISFSSKKSKAAEVKRSTIGPEYTMDPAWEACSDCEKGERFDFRFYGPPGTRNIAVIIPNSYLDDDAAAVLIDIEVGLAGPGAADAFEGPENCGDGAGTPRAEELVTVSDRYASFIGSKVLPNIETHPGIIANYPNFRFTDDPAGRVVLGQSNDIILVESVTVDTKIMSVYRLIQPFHISLTLIQ